MIAYDAALKINPDNAKTWIGKGLVHLKLGKSKRAIAACSKAISIKPDSSDAWYCKGMALSGLDKNEEALGALERALRLDPDNIEARKALASVNSKLGISLYEDEEDRMEDEKPKAKRSEWTIKKPTSEIIKKNLGQVREKKVKISRKSVRAKKE